MDYELRLSQDKTYIIVKFLVDVTNELGLRLNRDAAEFGAQHGISRYLHDVRGVRCLEGPVNQYLSTYKNVPGLGLSRRSKIAILTDPGDDSHDFIETLWQNISFNVKVFRDEYSAMRWLLV